MDGEIVRRKLFLGLQWVEDAVAMKWHYFRAVPRSEGRADRAQWLLQSQGPLNRCLCSSEVPLGSPCSGNRTPCLVRGERREMSVRAFEERHFTISHSSLKRPSCGILPCHRVKEFAPFVPIVVPLWKNLSSGWLWANVNRSVRVAILNWIRALFSSVSCLRQCPVQHLIFRGGSRNLAGSSYLIKFSREEIFFVVWSKIYYYLLRNHGIGGERN